MIAEEHRLALPAGYQLGKYRFKGVLGAGGFGITYLAEDPTLARRVAIKELLPNEIATRLDGTTVIAKTKSEESNLVWARERFLEEGKALAACEHPNVVHVYEMIEANGTAYMVTKFEDGRSLAQWLDNLGHPPTEAELRGLIEPLLSGLEKVHRAGFLHRDIKPENIYLTEDGRPLLLDFGSARQALTEHSALLTTIVTIGYAPFEQYYEDGKQGPWSDLYALAGVMYRAVHGEKPPEATRRIKNDTCTKLTKRYGKDYSTQFLHAIDKALAVEYQDRPQSVAAWRAMLGSGKAVAAEKLSISSREVWLGRLRQGAELASSHPRITAGAGVAGLFLCAWVIWKALSPAAMPGLVPVASVAAAPAALAPEVKPETPAAPMAPSTPPVPVATLVNPPVNVPSGNPNPPGVPAPADIVDPRLVGTWTTKCKIPPSRIAKTLRWEQSANGRWTTNGALTGSGTVSTKDGHIYRTSDLSNRVDDLTYEIDEKDELITTDPNDKTGPVTWHRTSSGVAKNTDSAPDKSSHSRGSGDDDHSSHGSSHHYYAPAPSFHLPSIPHFRLPF